MKFVVISSLTFFLCFTYTVIYTGADKRLLKENSRADCLIVKSWGESMKVGELCNREVVVIEGSASIRDAAKLMRQYHVGDVVVIKARPEGRVPIGILTDRDIVVELVAADLPLDDLLIADAMSFDLVTARSDDDVVDTVKEMRAKGIRRIPVVDEQGLLEGLLAADDSLELLAELMSDLVALVKNEKRREEFLRP
jgi:CBS domain-containing protein